jgi:transcriptional regulator with XRE-family HTH domain
VRKNLIAARKEKGMTQRQVAEKLSLSERSYQRIEAGDRAGKIDMWDQLEDLFGIHQRKLREITRPGIPQGNLLKRQKDQPIS